MLQTVRDICVFKQDAIDFALTKQIEDLGDLAGHTEADARAFFDKTFVTDGMSTLLRLALQRLAGQGDQAAFELRQAMGGGKTHSMLAIGYLAAHPEVADEIPAAVTQGFTPAKAKVVVISGRTISHDVFLWGDVARQLGKEQEFARFWSNGARAPNEDDWRALFGDEPTLILIDELPPYLEAAVTIPVRSGHLGDVTSHALANLLSAATKLPRLCIVLSTLVGQYRSSGELSKIISQISNEAKRQSKPITPVELGSDEIYHILRKRLLQNLPDPDVVETVASTYGTLLADAAKAKMIERSAERIAEEIAATYPFHPSLKTVVATFKDNEHFRQTRGLMTIAALMIKAAQKRQYNDVYLLGPQHLDLSDRDTRDFVNNIYNLDAAITQDIVDTGASDAHAEAIDAQAGNDAASQAARLLLMASLAEAADAVKGLQDTEVRAFLIAPGRSESEIIAGFDALVARSWYLHKRDNGAWFFSKNENLTKKIGNIAASTPQHKIDADLARRLLEIFAPKRRAAYARVLALPKVEDVDTKGDRLLIVLSPDAQVPPEKARILFEGTTEKNNFAIVGGDGHSLASVEDQIRLAYAIEKVLQQEGANSPNRLDLEKRQEDAEIDVYTTIASTLNKLWFPMRVPGTGDGLTSTALKLDAHRRAEGAGFDGETAIEKALTDTNAQKLVLAIDEDNYTKLRDRAQDMLWPAGDRRARWADIQDRAASHVRWLWLPRTGLDDLRKLALSRGDWRDSGTGWIEKGPFEKEKTSVTVDVLAFDEKTGEATLFVSAKDAGAHPVIRWSTTSDVSADSTILDDTTVRTTDMKRFFLAVDPDDGHEIGKATEWTNRLNLTHEPRTVGGGYEVELTVKPTGTIRWNLEGTNAAEGKVYDEPIRLDGKSDVTIYAYAEAEGVTVKKDFKVNRREGAGQKIDDNRAATIRKPVSLPSMEKVFAATTKAKEVGMTFRSVLVVVGSGANNISASFGGDVEVTAAAIEDVAKFARAQLGEELAEVKVTWKSAAIERAADIDAFMATIGETYEATDVEQK
jgi:hypothetical protein